MTIQEAIAKAIEGGYPVQRVEDLALHVQAEYFLETTFWEALVRALGIEGDGIVSKDACEPVDRLTLSGGTFRATILSKAKYYKHIVLLFGNKRALKSVNLLSRSVRQSQGDFEYIHLDRGEPRKLRQPLWLYYWHRFNSHLIAGNTPESFFATFSSPPEA